MKLVLTLLGGPVLVATVFGCTSSVPDDGLGAPDATSWTSPKRYPLVNPGDAVIGAVINPSESGDGITRFVVVGLDPKGPAARAGIKEDDRVLSVDGEPIASMEGLMNIIRRAGPGATIRVSIERGSEALTLTVELGVRPPR